MKPGENILREELIKSFKRERRVIYEMQTLLQQQAEALGKLEDTEFQNQLIKFIYATSEFQAAFVMAEQDDFRAVSQNPAVPIEKEE